MLAEDAGDLAGEWYVPFLSALRRTEDEMPVDDLHLVRDVEPSGIEPDMFLDVHGRTRGSTGAGGRTGRDLHGFLASSSSSTVAASTAETLAKMTRRYEDTLVGVNQQALLGFPYFIKAPAAHSAARAARRLGLRSCLRPAASRTPGSSG
ncbi:hypothetical protein [Streptomyces hydrogenans]|uniref:hypothetical protein n=1 Tax=Streptomyces hydrogenans TaxID=1873719 RepID=UPI003329EFF6